MNDQERLLVATATIKIWLEPVAANASDQEIMEQLSSTANWEDWELFGATWVDEAERVAE